MNDMIIVGWFITLFLLLVLTARIEKLEDAECVRRAQQSKDQETKK